MMKTKINDLALGIIKESVMLDNIDSATSALMEEELNAMIESTPSIKSVKLNPESVRLFEQDGSYYIELDELHKFNESNDMDSIQSLNTIAEYYNNTSDINLTPKNFFVAIESAHTYENMMRLVSEGNIVAASVVQSTIDEVKYLQENKVIVKKIEND